jgi:hypothetical protein
MEPEALYFQLGTLAADVPDFVKGGTLDSRTQQWLGRAAALIELTDARMDAINFRIYSDGLSGPLHETNAHAIVTILHRALARVELTVPAAASGAYIAVGAQFDVFQSIGKIFASAKSDLYIIDPYIDGSFLTRFAHLAPAGVLIRLIGESRYKVCGDGLSAAVKPWLEQYGDQRPVSSRRAKDRALHDRLFLIDNGAQCWSFGQSLKDIATHSPTAFVKLPVNVAIEKSAVYNEIWDASKPHI